MTHKHYHTNQSSVVHAIKTLPIFEIVQQYGIEIEDNGHIWDVVEQRRFTTLEDWAVYMDELNNDELYDNFSKIGSKQLFDDGC